MDVQRWGVRGGGETEKKEKEKNRKKQQQKTSAAVQKGRLQQVISACTVYHIYHTYSVQGDFDVMVSDTADPPDG